MSNKKIIEYIKDSEFFKDLNDEHLAIIAETSEIINYSKDEIIFHERDVSRDLYYIISGKVELYKTAHGKHISLGMINKKSFMGEMAFIDGSDRSASALACSDTKIIKFNFNLLQKNDPGLLNIITPRVCTIIMQRLRASNASNVKNIEEKLEQLKLQYEFGYFFTAIMVGLGVSTILEKVLVSTLYAASSNGYHDVVYDWIYLITVSAPFIYLVYLFKYKVTEFGVSINNLPRTLIESAIISVVGVFALLIIAYNPKADMNLLQTVNSAINADSVLVTLKVVTYLADACVQEFVSRGIFQTSLQKFLSDKLGFKSIFVTSTIYILGHSYFTLTAITLEFLTSLLFGMLFYRHKNIIGISLIHFFVGGAATALGLL